MGDVAAMTWPLTGPGVALLQPHRVRRCLFGPPDAEKTKLDLKALMDDVDQQNKLRWNFDFQKGVPIAGRFKWEPLDLADADRNGGSETQQKPVEEEDSTKKEGQTHITDFMRKRKSSNLKEPVTLRSKTRRRSST